MSTATATGPVAAGALVRPVWRQTRLWLVIAAVIVLGAVLVGSLVDAPGQPLDPGSTHRNGSRALARVLAQYGTEVTSSRTISSVTGPARTVLVTEPDDYSSTQLRLLRDRSARLVLVQPGTRATRAVLPGAAPEVAGSVDDAPDCQVPGATAAGEVNLPSDAIPYRSGSSGAQRCYGGAVLVGGRVVIIGSAKLLENQSLANEGAAALDVNLIGADRRIGAVGWLLPGADADGSGPASIWDVFPDGAHRAFLWLIALGVIAVLWRARRLGGVVTEPLPVIVRSVEVVEGHGRLYERAGARDRAAQALRAGVATRVATRLALPRGTPADQVAVALAPIVRTAPAELTALLAGPAPIDDRALLQLATDLDRLESSVRQEPAKENR
jgi:hypothetical protein